MCQNTKCPHKHKLDFEKIENGVCHAEFDNPGSCRRSKERCFFSHEIPNSLRSNKRMCREVERSKQRSTRKREERTATKESNRFPISTRADRSPTTNLEQVQKEKADKPTDDLSVHVSSLPSDQNKEPRSGCPLNSDQHEQRIDLNNYANNNDLPKTRQTQNTTANVTARTPQHIMMHTTPHHAIPQHATSQNNTPQLNTQPTHGAKPPMDAATGTWNTVRQRTFPQQTAPQLSTQQDSMTSMMDAAARTWGPTTQYTRFQQQSTQPNYEASLLDATTGTWDSQLQQAAPKQPSTQPPQYVTPIEHQHFLHMIRTMIQQQIPQFLMPMNQQIQPPTYYQQHYQ